MQKHTLATAFLTIGLAASAQADVIGATAGAYIWKQSWEGDVQSGSDAIDVNNDLGYDDDSGASIYVALEHPLPLIPNIRLQSTDMEISETSNLSRTFTFEGDVYTATDSIESSTDLSHTDATLYYEILDNWINLDLGLTVRLFDGEFRLKTTGREGSIELDAPLPMFYANARFELPLTGFYAAGLANLIGAGDNKVTDITMALGYEMGVVGLELGYRNFDASLEDGSEEADLTVDGYFLSFVVDI